MGRAETDDGLPTISICPRCGARLVTRNLWHSCGTYTLEDLFPTSEPVVLDLARKYVAMLYTLAVSQDFSRARTASLPAWRYTAGWKVRGSSRQRITGRAGGLTSWQYGPSRAGS
jgi:hypothetical protein